MSAIIYAIVNQKGGVGKTTTAINLAAYLSENGCKVLLIDADPQGNATSGLGIKQDQVQNQLYHYLIENAPLSDVLYPTPFDGLHIIPSNPDLAGAEVVMVNLNNRDQILKEKLKEVTPHYDYIIMDCPPSLGLLTINALVASTQVLIPVQCEYFALEGMAHLINTLTLVKDNLNPDLEIGGIILTMFDTRTTINKQVVENARHYFKDLVFKTVIPRNIRLCEAPSHGLPISLYDPLSRGALAYDQLAKEVMQNVRHSA